MATSVVQSRDPTGRVMPSSAVGRLQMRRTLGRRAAKSSRRVPSPGRDRTANQNRERADEETARQFIH